jgi:hypothetical protein
MEKAKWRRKGTFSGKKAPSIQHQHHITTSQFKAIFQPAAVKKTGAPFATWDLDALFFIFLFFPSL